MLISAARPLQRPAGLPRRARSSRPRAGRPRRDAGQGMVEYVLIVASVSLAVFASVALLGPEVRAVFHQMADCLRAGGC